MFVSGGAILVAGALVIRLYGVLWLENFASHTNNLFGQGLAFVFTVTFWTSQAFDISKNPDGSWFASSFLSGVFLFVNAYFLYEKYLRCSGRTKITARNWFAIYIISFGGAVANIIVVLANGLHLHLTDIISFTIALTWLVVCGFIYGHGKKMFRHRTGRGLSAAAFRAAPRLVKAAEWPFNGSAVGIATSLSALALALQRFLPAWYNYRRSGDQADRALMISEGIGNVLTVVPLILLWAIYQL